MIRTTDHLPPGMSRQQFDAMRAENAAAGRQVMSGAAYTLERLPNVVIAPNIPQEAMAEKDQNAVIRSSEFKAQSDGSYRTLTTICGLVALILILGAIVYLAINGQPGAAIAVAGMGAAGIISAFVNGRMHSAATDAKPK